MNRLSLLAPGRNGGRRCDQAWVVGFGLEHFSPLVWISLLVIFLSTLPLTGQVVDEAFWQSVQLQISTPTFETTIVAFHVLGPGPMDELTMEDVGILFNEGGGRALPLLRLLGGLQVDVKQRQDTLKFQPPGGAVRLLALGSGTMRFLGQFERRIPLQLGISDANGQPEIFVADTVASQLLGLPLQWDQSKYEYAGATKAIYGAFAENYKPRASLLSYAREAEAFATPLPEMLPPAEPNANSDLLTFIQLRLFGVANGFQNAARRVTPGPNGTPAILMNYSLHPQFQVWGRMLGGNYSLDLARTWNHPQSTYRQQLQFRGEWSKRIANVGLTLGDNSVALNDLIFPYLALRGLAFGGAAGIKTRRLNRGNFEARQFFSPLQVFEGHAKLGSTVELYVNGRLHDQRDVREDITAPPGEGSYRFDGVNLLSGYTNEIRLVIKRPDGLREEIRREVLGTERLLQSGQWAMIGGIGRQRVWSFEGYRTQGLFAGGRFLYGLHRRLTLGFTGAFQQDINRSTSQFAFSDDFILRKTPAQSAHAGAELALRINDHLVANSEIAGSLAHGDSTFYLGGQFGAEIQFGQLRFEPRLFRFEPGFFNGVNSSWEDREGYALRSYWNAGRKLRFQLGGGQIRDNVRHQRPQTTIANFQQAKIHFSEMIPKTTVSLVGERRHTLQQSEQRSYSVEANSYLPLNLSLSTRYGFGDELVFNERDLFSAPNSGYIPFYESRGWLIDLSWDPPSPSSFSVNHWQTPGFERSLLTYTYGSTYNQRWQAQTEFGHDWSRDKHFGQGRLEYALDAWNENRVGVLCRFQEVWSVELVFQLQNLFSVSRSGVNRLSQVRLEPGQGGVWGRTFLDLNANGWPDAGEPGLSGIDVISHGAWGVKTKSNKRGQFFLASSSQEDSLRVSLNSKSLPAIYTVTQGTQLARLAPGAFTRVFLGIASLGTISGNVYERTLEGQLKGVAGVKVILIRADSLRRAGESVTAEDGGYYLGEVKPGEYLLTLEAKTLAPGYFITGDAIPPHERVAETTEIWQRLGIGPLRMSKHLIRKVHMMAAATPIDLEKLDFILQRE